MIDPVFRANLLASFVVDNPTDTRIVNDSLFPGGVSATDKDKLMRYHPKVGRDYAVTCDVQWDRREHPNKKDDPNSYLTITPVPMPGVIPGWNGEQTTLLEQLKFVPTVEVEVPGQINPGLMMMRSGTGTNFALANTPWRLVNAWLKKTTINRIEHNDVILTWEYIASNGASPFLKPVLTSWKWRNQQ